MTKECIEDMREIVLPYVKKRLLEINYENLGESDAEEFAREFNEILDLAIKALEQEPTTKNDLVSSIVEEISEQVTETHEEFIFETIRPYCENVVQMKISKRDLEQALLKYYGKNDLGVDCISRADARSLICDIDLKHHTFGMSRKAFKDLYNGMDELPSITPQEPRWIPVSERLPEVGHRVIFSMKNDEIYIGTLHTSYNDLKITLEPTGIGYVYSFENVVAWMPLPQPYKAESEDK